MNEKLFRALCAWIGNEANEFPTLWPGGNSAVGFVWERELPDARHLIISFQAGECRASAFTNEMELGGGDRDRRVVFSESELAQLLEWVTAPESKPLPPAPDADSGAADGDRGAGHGQGENR